MFPGTPSVQLEVTTVVLEFENVTEAVVVVEVPVFVTLPFVELRMVEIVDVVATPFVSVLVTVVRIPEPEDASLTVVDPEFVTVVFSPGVGWLVWDVVVEVICVVPVMGLPAELLVLGILALFEPVGELPLLVDVVEVELDEPLLALFKAVVDIDDPRPVTLPEGMEEVSVMINVVVFETGPLEVGDVVSVFEVLLEEEGVEAPGVCVLEVDEPDELIAVPPPLVAEEEVKVVGSVMAESVHDGEPDDQGGPLETELCVVKNIVDVVSQTGTVMLPEIVVTLAAPLVPIVALLAVDPEEGLEDVDHDEPDPPGEPVNAVGLLLGGGSVNPG
ncbi:hypothetical protein F4782DRAFT_552442 [Xylaria castorea]|nr:hypothetical protein F4782DRAFT_552442 [Xylaria castorea]